MLRFRKMSQFVIYLLCKLENPISIPRIQKGKPGMVAHNCSPSTGEAENGGHWGLLTRRLCLLVNSAATGTVSQKKCGELLRLTLVYIHTIHTHPITHTHTHAELHTYYMHIDIHITSTHKNVLTSQRRTEKRVDVQSVCKGQLCALAPGFHGATVRQTTCAHTEVTWWSI